MPSSTLIEYKFNAYMCVGFGMGADGTDTAIKIIGIGTVVSQKIK